MAAFRLAPIVSPARTPESPTEAGYPLWLQRNAQDAGRARYRLRLPFFIRQRVAAYSHTSRARSRVNVVPLRVDELPGQFHIQHLRVLPRRRTLNLIFKETLVQCWYLARVAKLNLSALHSPSPASRRRHLSAKFGRMSSENSGRLETSATWWS